jgi:amino acid transporter
VDSDAEGPSKLERDVIADDVRTLHEMGYEQELRRGLGGFSNFALSFSIICILAGGVTSFHLGLCGVGGASIGFGWPLVSLFTLAVAATMAQLASAFPTSGGLYHWASILGGRGWGWATAWFNLAGLITAVSAINVGAWTFALGSIGPLLGFEATPSPTSQAVAVALITASQATLNHLGIRLTSRLTDLSGYLILSVSLALTAAMLAFASDLDPTRLITFANFSGESGGGVWPRSDSLLRLFALGFLLPAYTLTGFDASAHASEETINAARVVPRGILRSVLVSGLAGWVMLMSVILAVPDLREIASRGDRAFPSALEAVLPRALAATLEVGIVLAMYGCGLGAVTSASRMAFAFARDGGLPGSPVFRRVSARFRTPAASVWLVAILAWLFTLWARFYSTMTAVCIIFLYVSYVLPTALGALAYGRSWTRMGPFHLGRWFRPLAVVGVLGCSGLIAIGIQPPNDFSSWVVGGTVALMVLVWFGVERRRFAGPPHLGETARQESILSEGGPAESCRPGGDPRPLRPRRRT